MTRFIAAGFVVLIVSVAAPAVAESQEAMNDARVQIVAATRQPRPARRSGLGFRAFMFSDGTDLAAKKTFDAVLGQTSVFGFGGGAEAVGIWKGLFARLAVSRMKEVGTRVFVFDDEVFPLDIPLTVEMTPVEVAAGWRFDRRLFGRISPYGGGGLLRVRYRETAEFAATGDDIDESFGGQVAFGGIDVDLWKGVTVGVEVQYRTVPKALGTGGVSEVFGETDLGGTTFRVLVGFRK